MIWPFKKEPAIPFAEYAMTLPTPPCGDNVAHYEADVNGMACPKCRADRTRREKDAELDALTDKIMARLCAPSSGLPPEPSSGALAGMAALVPGACWPPFAQTPSPPTDEMQRGVGAVQPDRAAELERVVRLVAAVQTAPGHGYDLDAMDEAIVAARTVLAHGVMASDAPLPPDVLYDLAIQAGLGDELWFGKHMPKNPDYEDATPKLEKFAKLVRSYGVPGSQAQQQEAQRK